MTSKGLKWDEMEQRVFPNGRNYLLVIGIDNYKHFEPLNNAVRDAQTFRDVLLQKYQFQLKDLIQVYNEEATRRNILGKLEELEDLVTVEDNLIIYFSGHGTINSRKSKGFWIPVDAEKHQSDYISNSDVIENLKDIQAHHIYLIVDSCFSGKMATRSGEFAKRVESNPSRRILASGRTEMVSDGRPGGHSPFANCLLTCLNTNQEFLTATKLEQYVKENTANVAKQTPFSTYIFDLGGQIGEFVFHPKLDPKVELITYEDAKKSLYNENTERRKVREQDGKYFYKKNNNSFSDSQYLQEAKTQSQIGESNLGHFLPPPLHRYFQHPKNILKGLKKAIGIKKKPQKGPIEMIFVEGGTFIMGSLETEEGRRNDEGPCHPVQIGDFEIGKYPVTQRQWNNVMGNFHGYPFQFIDNNEYIMGKVSWFDIQEFIAKLNQKSTGNYRLPTEAEWEFAARGGIFSKGYRYSGSNNLEQVGWYKENSNDKAIPIGLKLPNELGIYDMSGNVWEWVQDRWHKDYSNAPSDGKEWIDQKRSEFRILRGGSIVDHERECRCKCRNLSVPQSKYSNFGFRLARTVP